MIKLLDNNTIDKIAAGEVVERPASVVKELVENAIDAGAGFISVEIKNGGIDLIRVTDDGKGIPKDEIKTAFLRHATSKIDDENDLNYINTLGFRGEALPSIASVAQVQFITKTLDQISGFSYRVDGGIDKEFEEIGAPDGTSIIVRNIFFNVPVRKKFLKSPQTEAAYITDLIEKLALSNPHISFKLTVNKSVKLQTKGNGDLKEVIYKIYGKETARALIPVEFEKEGVLITGYIAKPEINNGTRDSENYYINHRYIKSEVISKAIDEGYREFMMQHRFPFCVLNLDIDTTKIDVNVHPQKMDVRIQDAAEISEFLSTNIKDSLKGKELIPEVKLVINEAKAEKVFAPEPFEVTRISKEIIPDEPKKVENEPAPSIVITTEDDHGKFFEFEYDETEDEPIIKVDNFVTENVVDEEAFKPKIEIPLVDDFKQTNLFEEKILTDNYIDKIKVLGQLFDTYWLIEFDNKLYMLDQHAAHEKIKYEEFVKKYHNKEIVSQNLSPAYVINLSNVDMAVFKEYEEYFTNAGFEIEEFGSNELYVVAVPVDFYNCSIEEIFFSILNELKLGNKNKSVIAIEENIATMACKAAVKGNNKLSYEEIKELLYDLLKLDNPYNCPHGRPTMVTFTKYEIEKKFKRIV